MAKHRRQRYIVDGKLQFGVTLRILAVPAVVALLYALALFILPESDVFEGRTGAEARDLIVRATFVYFLLGSAILAAVALLLTHRIAGPAFAIERAVRRMLAGEEPELHLRKRDHLKGLASAILEMHELRKKEQETTRDLARCVQEGDLDGAREIAARVEPATAAHAPDLREVEQHAR